MSRYVWADAGAGRDLRARVAMHAPILARRGDPLSAEHLPPVGQAAGWYWELVACGAPRSARLVGRQLARLAGHDADVSTPWRSLADAVGEADSAGRTRAYVEGGASRLVDAGWLNVETTGKGCTARTTFSILPGDRSSWRWLDGEDDAGPEIEAA